MRSSGTLDEGHAALVAMVEGLAEAVDEDRGNAALWREYRAALATLEGVGGDGVDDAYASLTVEVRGTKVVDASDSGPGDARPRRGRGGKGDGAAADAVATVGRRRRT